MARFGIEDEKVRQWQDNSIELEGKNEIAIILIHGWSAFPRQMLDLGKKLKEKGYWIFIPRLKGHGRTPEDLESVTAENWIRNIDEAVEIVRQNPKIKKICVGGNSMGGNLALLAGAKKQADAIFILGAPVHIRHHFFIWILSRILGYFNLYSKKTYPKKIKGDYPGETSYQFFPIRSVAECLKVIKKSVFSLPKITAPILILQTNLDYMVTKYSPWVIYNLVKSKTKKLRWIQSKYQNHTMMGEEMNEAGEMVGNFLKEIFNEKNK